MTAQDDKKLDHAFGCLKYLYGKANYLIYVGDKPFEDEMTDEDLRAAIIETLENYDQKLIVFFRYADGDDGFEFAIDEFISVVEECKTIVESIHATFVTSSRAIQLVEAGNERAYGLLHHRNSVRAVSGDHSVEICLNSFLLSFYATVNEYCGEYLSPCDFISIEVKPTKAEHPFDVKVVGLIDSYRFELASTHGVILNKSSFVPYDEYPDWYDDEDLQSELKLRPLENSNEGIKLFNAANQVDDPALRFISFYKVLEHFGPVVKRLEIHETIRKKLDSPEALSPDADFIDELVKLSKPFHKTADKELVKLVIQKAINLDDLRKHLPQSLEKKKAQDLSDVICDTRNLFAHAKAGYERTGKECEGEDLKSLTKFVSLAGANAIRWYNRLPDHLRLPTELN